MKEVTRRVRRRLNSCGGFTLFELVITLTILSILVMGTIPIAQNAVKRQREVRLRETLRIVRNAIDEFKRDSVGACLAGSTNSVGGIGGIGGNRPNINTSAPADPRSRVIIDDCTIFDTENLDRLPPSLQILVDGVKVRQRGPSANLTGGSGISLGTTQATELNETEEIKKVYLRELPIDPMTGNSEWKFRSSYQASDDDSWDEINVFDVRSSSKETALNGEKYSDW